MSRVAVPENLHAGSAASGSIDKVNQTARTSAAPAIRYEGGVARAAAKSVSALSAPLTAPPLVVIKALPAVEPVSNHDGRATCTANFATFVDKSRIASCRSVEECQFAVIAEGGFASARATCKNDSSRVCKRG